jgi:hypothetical protein
MVGLAGDGLEEGDKVVALQFRAIESPSHSVAGLEKSVCHRTAIVQFGDGKAIPMLDDCAAVDKLGTWGSGGYSGKRGEREEERQQQEGAHLYGSLIEEIGKYKVAPCSRPCCLCQAM